MDTCIHVHHTEDSGRTVTTDILAVLIMLTAKRKESRLNAIVNATINRSKGEDKRCSFRQTGVEWKQERGCGHRNRRDKQDRRANPCNIGHVTL